VYRKWKFWCEIIPLKTGNSEFCKVNTQLYFELLCEKYQLSAQFRNAAILLLKFPPFKNGSTVDVTEVNPQS